MTTELQYALMAGRAYFSTRDQINRFPIPDGWAQLGTSLDNNSGFEAIAFQNGNEIVISYAGTFDSADAAADAALGSGIAWSAQLGEAAAFYLGLRQIYPTATFSFTGHSLGGGLAALMAVFFDETAVTFDQAPFALSLGMRDTLIAHLKVDYGYTDQQLLALAPSLVNPLTPGNGASNVTNRSVQGEILSAASGLRIGAELDPIAHGDYSAPVDLHSQALLTAFLQSQQTAATGQALNNVTYKLTDLLGMIFDTNLFAHPTDPNSPDVNLLEHLVRHQAGGIGGVPTGGDAMLTRFTRDLWKIAQDGGLTLTDANMAKTLTAFAMQMYYENPNATSADKELFGTENVSGGLRFNREDVAANLSDAKGYGRYFLGYLRDNFAGSELDKIISALPGLKDWYIQAGASGMNATGDTERAFMLGGSGDDQLTGGSQADVLAGNGGADTLTGGDGEDLLIGGAGNDTLDGLDGQDSDTLLGGADYDTYNADGGDTLRDSDGSGIVNYGPDKIQLKGGSRKNAGDPFVSDDKTVVYVEQANGTVIAYTPAGTITITADVVTGTSNDPDGDTVSGIPNMKGAQGQV